MSLVNEFFIIIYDFYILTLNQLRKLYLSSSYYNKKISKFDGKSLSYKPSLSILSCLVKYDKSKNKLEDLNFESIWENKNIDEKNFKKLNSFYWLFSIDLKSSSHLTHSIIEKWIDKFGNLNSKNWQVDILSKRIIAWISNSKLTYDGSSSLYKEKFDYQIYKQINHLINEINRSENVSDKMLGCSAIILVGLSYHNEKYLEYGLSLLKRIIGISFDNDYFPKSRSIRQMTFYLKYFVLIRELLKESLNEIPHYLDEIIFYLGKSYSLLINKKQSFLFNGNHVSNSEDFEKYLNLNKYKFRSDNNQAGGYAVLKNKDCAMCMDIGNSPSKKFSENYQSGALSFEFFYKNQKLISNCGYFQDYNSKLNKVSKSTAAHSTLNLDNSSSTTFLSKQGGRSFLKNNVKITSTKIVSEKKFWSIQASHDGYQKQLGITHNRKIDINLEKLEILGIDKLLKKNSNKTIPFDVRFHFVPGIKLTKTQDNKSVLIEMENSGWKFFTNSGSISIESGIYLGNKNRTEQNQNICISGLCDAEDQIIEWKFFRI